MKPDYEVQHRKLMKAWSQKASHRGKDFIKDGIIDVSRWNNAEKKILLLLKEAYGDYGDLCYLIRDEWNGPKYKIWWTASYWLYALQKTSDTDIPLFPQEQKQKEECAEYLLSSAVVNIKKSDGKTASDYDEIFRYAQSDASLLERQISLIAPDIILCGNTFDYLKQFWHEDIFQVSETGFMHKTKQCLVVDYWHPANQYPDELCFYTLCAVLQKAKANGLE